jgi:hypothetical protein
MSSALTLLARLRGTARAETHMSSLREDATLRIEPGKAGVTVRCDAGTLLVTQEGDPSDHVLGPGDELRVAGRGLAVAWALSDAVLTVLRPAPLMSPGGRTDSASPWWRAPPAAGGCGDASPCTDPRAPHPG